LEKASDWNHDCIEAVFNKVMKDYDLKLGKVAQPVRVALTGGTTSPSIFEVIQVLGRETTLRRLKEVFPLCGA
jgi:glutamyl-tRNA synthetase